MAIAASLPALVADNADRVYLIETATGRHMSFGQFWDHAGRLAGALAAQGVTNGDRILLCLPNSAELAVLYFACLRLGATAMPVHPATPVGDIAYIRSISHPRLNVFTVANAELFAESGEACWQLTLGQGGLLEEPLPAPPADLPPLDDARLFAITFTSGTTGRPKGVAHFVGGLFGNARAFNELEGVNRDSRYYHILPMTYMAGLLNTLLCPFIAGGSVVVAGAFDSRMALRFWDDAIRFSANTTWLTPSIAAALLQIDRNPAGKDYCRTSMRHIFVGTAPLSEKVKTKFEAAYGAELLESYGLSELLFISANTPRAARVPHSVGPLLPGVSVRFAIPEDGNGTHKDNSGAIEVRTDYVMAGYLAPETGEIDTPAPGSWFPTGDLGMLNNQGDLFITGRQKDLIICAGGNVSPRAVEEALMRFPGIAEAAVVGLPHDLKGEEVVAALHLEPGFALEAMRTELGAWCRQHLSPLSVPSRFVTIESLPRNMNGKVQKAALQTMLLAAASS